MHYSFTELLNFMIFSYININMENEYGYASSSIEVNMKCRYSRSIVQ